MKSGVELNELMERIRQAANRENGLIGGAAREVSSTTDLPPVPEGLPLPPAPMTAMTNAIGNTRPEVLLDEAASLLQGGRKKNAVPEGVPTVLRQLFRNQGGVNGVVLEAVERLVEVNRNLRQQNYELHERMMDLYTWAHAAVDASAENRGWMLVADTRLRPGGESRFSHIEERLARLEERGAQGADNEPPTSSTASQRIEAQLAELAARSRAMEAEAARQAEYIRSVHGHLDRLGAHVEAGFSRRMGEG